jgi:hypothetical protein
MANRDADAKSKRKERGDTALRLDTAALALFFIWVGVALLGKWGFGVGLVGVGVIALAHQGTRSLFKLKVQGFWIFVGLLLVMGGLWQTFQAKFEFGPFVLILAGLALLVSAIRGKKQSKE